MPAEKLTAIDIPTMAVGMRTRTSTAPTDLLILLDPVEDDVSRALRTEDRGGLQGLSLQALGGQARDADAG
jgi:hypothetical protein